ncbi:MAG: DnaJ domain-containing protein [Myxococcota bacterium]
MIDRLDYYQLLKLDPRANSSQLRVAYHDARKRFHPDCFLAEPDEIRGAVDRIARRITEGYMVLRDRNRRAAYDNALTSGHLRLSHEVEEEAKTEVQQQRGTTPNGKRYLTLCEEEERRGALPKAIQQLKTAITFEPKNLVFRQKLDRLEQQLKAAKKGSTPKI